MDVRCHRVIEATVASSAVVAKKEKAESSSKARWLVASVDHCALDGGTKSW